MIHSAATVIVVRPRPGDGQPLVYLTQRHPDMRFLANYIVFPGGNVDPADHHERWRDCISGRSLAAVAERLGAPGPEALSIWVAAMRELCEEAGLVLATPAAAGDADGPLADGPLADVPAEQRQAWQQALVAGETDFLTIITEHRLKLALDRLHYMDRRVGPPGARVRYDTRYFLALLPPGQEPIPCRREVAQAFWMTPAEALAAWSRQELLMVPPTVATLRTLRDFATVDDLMRAATGPDGLKMQGFPPFF